MPNKYRGEIGAELGGRQRTLVLTLGALAELESAFGAGDLMALAERFFGACVVARSYPYHRRRPARRGRGCERR